MKLERIILITFLANYLINYDVAAMAAFFPTTAVTGAVTVQYIAFVILAAILVALCTWWYLKTFSSNMAMKAGIIFGVLGFVVSIATAFNTGVSGVLIQTTSFSTLWGVLPNFGPFLMSWATVALLGYWVIPAILIGWWRGRSMTPANVSHAMPQRTVNPNQPVGGGM